MRFRSLAWLALFPTLAPAQTPPRAEPEITTAGTGEVRLPADQALVFIGIQTGAASASEAASRNGELARRVQSAVVALGFAETDVRFVGFGVWPNYDNRSGRRLVDYQARTQIEVTLRAFERLGPLLDAGLSAGGTDVSNPQFISDTVDRARESALKVAFEHARREAAALATAAGGRLGAVRGIATQTNPTGLNQVVTTAFALESGQPGAPNVRREVVVRVWVQVRWGLEP